ncbi:MAG TPA: 4-(cytidine 5'-diphospho)-2-C-methyl-D-erythritol kinase [Acidobacteriaceae bacterium]
MPTSIRSHSKINLGLAIGASRTDGFHGLTTVYQTLALHDLVIVHAERAPRTTIALTSDHPRVPVDASNTAWRMTELVLSELGISAEVQIHIEKRLPVQGGLGAGSANAVAALLALEHELEIEIPKSERLRLAARIGSDVPLFLVGGAVLGVGRGEEVYPLPETPSMPCVIAIPEIGVSTPEAYRAWDKAHPISSPDSLTGPSPSATIERLSRSIAVAFGEPYSSGVFSEGEDLAETPLLALVRTGIENDFEQVVFLQHPFLGNIKRVLSGSLGAEESAVFVSLSGSGSALFGLYRSIESANAALERLETVGLPGLLTRTLPRNEYWRGIRVL